MTFTTVTGALTNTALVFALSSTGQVYGINADGSLSLVSLPPSATGTRVDRVAGDDRYVTAVEVSRASFADGAVVGTVVVASGENFPDALSAAPAAVKLGGPLLLTPKGELPQVVAAEIRRLDPERIILVGGPAAVDNTVLNALRQLASAERVSGTDRYQTSLAVAKYAFPGASSEVFVATGRNFPDALSASAYAGAKGVPVILVDGTTGQLPGGVAAWLRGAGVKTARIAGGTGVVSAPTAATLRTQAGVVTPRYGGSDRYETSQRVNTLFDQVPTAYLATGLKFPDALAGAAAAGRAQAPLFVVPQACVPVPVLERFAQQATSPVNILGGTATLTGRIAQLTPC
jgi:putative cell wall-binding protein